jgi:hypothetical protein
MGKPCVHSHHPKIQGYLRVEDLKSSTLLVPMPESWTWQRKVPKLISPPLKKGWYHWVYHLRDHGDLMGFNHQIIMVLISLMGISWDHTPQLTVWPWELPMIGGQNHLPSPWQSLWKLGMLNVGRWSDWLKMGIVMDLLDGHSFLALKHLLIPITSHHTE